jgi:hypothetical protein
VLKTQVTAAEHLYPLMQQLPEVGALHSETTRYNVSKITSVDSNTLL